MSTTPTPTPTVIPAKAGIHAGHGADASMDPRLRGGDGMRSALAVIALLCLSFPAAAQPDAERIAELKNFVVQDCGSCHGLTMQGGLGSPLTRERLAEFSTEALAYTILEGRPGTPMPPWRGLVDEAEAEWIARFLKGEADG